MLFNLPAGLFDGQRQALASGALLLALGAATTATARGFRQLVLGSALTGGGEAVFNIGTQSLLRNTVPSSLHGRALSVLAAIPRWATTVAPVLGSHLVSLLGWPAPFLAFALLALAAAAVVLLQPAPPGLPKEIALPGGSSGARSAARAGTTRLADVARVHWHAFATAGLAVACLNALRAVRSLYLPLHGANAGLSPVQVGWAATVGFLLDSALIVPAGMVMDARGRKPTSVPAFLLLSAGVAAIPAAQSAAGLAAVGALLGCGNGLSAGISGTLAADFSPPAPDTGAFLGLWRLVADAGSLVGPVAAGWLSKRTSLTVAARLIGLFGCAGAAWLALMVPETGGQDAAARKRERLRATHSAAARQASWATHSRRTRRALAAWLRGRRRPDAMRLLHTV